MRLLPFLAALTLLLLAVPARAHAAVTLGTGGKPGVAVDAAGTAYIAWYDNTTSQIHYCRLPRGATACDVTLTLTPDGQTLSRPAVVLNGSEVDIYTSRYGLSGQFFDETFEYASTDGGASFAGPVAAGTLTFDESAPSAGGLLGATNADSGGGLVQYLQRATFASTTANLFPTTYLYNGAVAFYNGSATAIAVFTDASDNAQFRVSESAGYNDVASWNPASAISGFTAYPKLADGPSGLFLLSGADGGGLQVRRFNGGFFAAPVALLAGVQASEASIDQDAAGRLHVVGPRFAADGIHLDYAYSDDGVSWTASSLAVSPTEEQEETQVAAAADHAGVAVWRDSSTSNIEASSLAATAAPPAPPGISPTPTPTPTPAPTPVFHSTVVVAAVRGSVLVKLKGASKYVALRGASSVPLGSTVDTRKGTILLSSVPKKGARAQTAQFYDGIFKVTQPGAVTQLQLVEALAPCKKGARAAARKPKSRKLWGNGSGAFSTRGQYSAATVRGTQWLVQDSCAGTLTQVRRGVVSVRDFARGKTIVVRAGKRYVAKARR